jgi:hypothetical protein
MTKPDPSSPLEDDALDFLAESLEPQEQTPVQGTEASPYTAKDEDRLYTDDFIRQNESAARFLFLSVLGAGMICIGVGIWYVMSRNQTQPEQSTPLQVPVQPSFAPLPPLKPNPPLPGQFAPGQTLPPSDSVPLDSLPSDSGTRPGNPSESPFLQQPSNPNLPLNSPVPPPPPAALPQ